jgi:hypothetical protein
MNERQSAEAHNGPLEGNPNLTARELPTGWESPIVWRDGPARHLYRWMTMANTRWEGAKPVYAFIRTLEPEEPTPATA